MTTLFRPCRPYPIPPGAEVRPSYGKQHTPHVAVIEKGRTVWYPVSEDGTRFLKPSPKWVADVVQADGTRKRVRFSPNHDASALMLAALLTKIENEKIGIRDVFKGHRRKPIAEHVTDWLSVLTSRGRDAGYTALKKARVTAILDGCAFVFTSDLSAESLERFLDSLRKGVKKLSVQTTNDYLQAASQFCNWMVENERLERNPFVKVQKGNAERDRRHVRRPLDLAELQQLVAGVRSAGTTRRKLSAESRAVLYATGAYSGYRAGELAELTPENFLLDGGTPTIELSGEHTKNGKDASQPISAELVDTLRVFLKGLPTGKPCWPGTWSARCAEMIRKDAEAAGLTLDIDSRDGPLVLDFHSLRGTYATFLDGLDMSLKTRQELMRHSDPRLTMNRYTKVKLHDMGLAIQSLPKLSPTEPNRVNEVATLRMTGTSANEAVSAQQARSTGAAEPGYVRLRVGMIEETSPPDEAGMERLNPLENQGVEEDQGQLRTIGAERAGFSDRNPDICSRKQHRLEILVHSEVTSRPVDRQVLGDRNTDCHKTATRTQPDLRCPKALSRSSISIATTLRSM